MEIRDFTFQEIGEIYQYISANVPYTILSSMFIITENLTEKSKAFCIIYRIVNGAKNYVEDKKTKAKLSALLEECKDSYNKLYNLTTTNENSTLNYGSHITKHQIKSLFNNQEENFKINKLIDAFLIFAEKLVLLETNKVVGLEIDTEEGRDFYKKILGGSEVKT